MNITPAQFPEFFAAITASLEARADEIAALDQAIGDGDHLVNLQRGLAALRARGEDFATLDWPTAWRTVGMAVMSAVGGASGSLYGTLFLAMGKSPCERPGLAYIADAFAQGVDAMKQRGKSDVGDKTMLDVLVPVAAALQECAAGAKRMDEIIGIAEAGAESTRDMMPAKGRASFLGERALGHVDAGARTAEIMIASIIATARTLAAS